jgi:hypothetical protein
MTMEEMRTITRRAAAICNAAPYGEPKLEDGIWTVGFKQFKEIMALQVEFSDRQLANDSDLERAEMALEKTMQTAILMST